jgi:hypothetical protein
VGAFFVEFGLIRTASGPSSRRGRSRDIISTQADDLGDPTDRCTVKLGPNLRNLQEVAVAKNIVDEYAGCETSASRDTPSPRLASISRGRGWSLFRV